MSASAGPENLRLRRAAREKEANLPTSKKPLSRSSLPEYSGKGKENEHNDAGAWWRAMEKLNYSAEEQSEQKESAIIHDHIRRETRMMRAWSREARSLISMKVHETRVNDAKDLTELRRMNQELDDRRIKAPLLYASLAAVVAKKERTRLKKKLKSDLLEKEPELLSDSHKNRVSLVKDLWERTKQRRQDIRAAFREGPSLLKRIGDIMQQTCNNMVQKQAQALISAMTEQGLDFEKLKLSSVSNRLHRKMTLNPLDMSMNMILQNSDLTVLHTGAPSVDSKGNDEDDVQDDFRWGMVRASDGPYPIPRYDRPLMREIVEDAIPTIAELTGRHALHTLTQIIDAVHPSQRLHNAIAENPSEARKVIQGRLEQLGYTHSLHSLQKCTSDSEIRTAVKEVLQKVHARLKCWGRFYFEVHPHGEPFPVSRWVIGWTTNPLRSSFFPGSDPDSFGFDSEGMMWHNGVGYRYATSLLHYKIIGLLADLNTGTLTLYADGKSFGAGFGVDSIVFDADEQTRQAEIVRTKHLIPAFALFAHTQSEQSSALLNSSSGTPSKMDKPQSRTGLASANRGRRATLSGSPLTVPPSQQEKERQVNLGPALSVNFGSFPFIHRAPDTISADAYLELSAAQVQGNNESESNESLFGGNFKKNASRMPPATYDLQMGEKEFLFKHMMEYEKPLSWSKFPPEQHLRTSCAMRIQRSARRFLGRRFRKRLFATILKAVVLLQRIFRRRFMIIRRRRKQAAIVIQRYFKRYRARSRLRICVIYQHTPDELETAALVVQTYTRRFLAQLRAQREAQRLCALIFRIHSMAKKIQRWFKCVKKEREERRQREIERATIIFQRVWRGRRARIALSHQGPRKARKLLAIGHRIVLQWRRTKAAALVQKTYRGFVDRKYFKLRRMVFDRKSRLIQKHWRRYSVSIKFLEKYDVGVAQAAIHLIKVLYDRKERARQRRKAASQVTKDGHYPMPPAGEKVVDYARRSSISYPTPPAFLERFRRMR
eukprot:GILK01011122.1.p1 GENE.GILK01011122.1~~GILK01011122.1.p1  ORF type:complete len:1022 (+),score=126.54 GILK01011122.1:72-3068(+)